MQDLERVIEGVRAALPEVQVRRLKVTHPGDDDGLWFFELPGTRNQVQLESSTGLCSLIVEGYGEGRCFSCDRRMPPQKP